MTAVGRLWPSDDDDERLLDDERGQAGDDQISQPGDDDDDDERFLDDERGQARDGQISQPGALSQIRDSVESGRKTSLQLKTSKRWTN